MRIAIASPGRFHVLDLARELHSLGHEVRFYSYVPGFRSKRFGLPEACGRSIFWWGAPLLALNRVLGFLGLGAPLNSVQRAWCDWVTSTRLEPCDVMIAMSGCFSLSIAKAKKRWNAVILVERASRHINSQKEILDEVHALHPGAATVPDVDVHRELRDYALADRIVVPSRHVVESFVENGVPRERLFRNPFGVDLSMFSPTPVPAGPPTVLMVGTWCYRKGCDLLVEALRGLDFRLLHAGPLGDCPFPSGAGFETLGILDQTKLKEVYARGHIMALPSREEGLAFVQAQALACGLGLVCSDRTGGDDLREILEDPGLVTVVKTGDVGGLREGLRQAMRLAQSKKGLRDSSGASLEKLSWKAYGLRYDAFLRGLVPAKAL